MSVVVVEGKEFMLAEKGKAVLGTREATRQRRGVLPSSKLVAEHSRAQQSSVEQEKENGSANQISVAKL